MATARAAPSQAGDRALRATLCAGLLLALPGHARAVRIDYRFDLSVLHSDNIARSTTDPIAETVFAPQLSFDVRRNGSGLRLESRGQLQRLHYLGDRFPAEWRGGFAGQLDWTLVPQRLSFVLEDYLSREPVNLLDSLSPDNQQQVNVLVAGPDLFARLGPATRAEIELRYGHSHADESRTFNGHRSSVAARVLRDISAWQRGSLHLEATRAGFDLSTKYTLRNAYVGYGLERPAFRLELAAGSSRLDPWMAGVPASTPLLRGDLEWKVTPRSVLSARWRSGFSDATEYLVVQGRDIDAPAAPDLRRMDFPVHIGAGAFRERRADIGYRFDGERLGLELRPHYEQVQYLEDIVPDHRSRGGSFSLEYRLRPRTTLSLVAARQHRRFIDIAREDTDLAAGIGFVERVTRHWSWRVDVQHRRRDSSVEGQAYDENAAILAVGYER